MIFLPLSREALFVAYIGAPAAIKNYSQNSKKPFKNAILKRPKELCHIVLEVSIKCFNVRFLFKHEDELYKEVFPGKIEAHLSVTVDMHG